MKYYGYEENELIPELIDWKKLNGEDFSIEDWGYANLTPELIIGMADFFFPKFAEFNGGIFFEQSIPKLTEQLAEGQWKDLDIIELQYIYNHQHLLDYFAGRNESEISRIQLECIGKILIDVWGLKLKANFPNRNIHFEFDGLDSENKIDLVIWFWAD